MNKVYISGPVTGIENKNIEAFNNAETMLWDDGYFVVNPLKIEVEKENPTWFDYMKVDIKALLECDYIYMLPNWEKSKVARIEKFIALIFGIKEI
jgi:hypothetical protein